MMLVLSLALAAPVPVKSQTVEMRGREAQEGPDREKVVAAAGAAEGDAHRARGEARA